MKKKLIFFWVLAALMVTFLAAAAGFAGYTSQLVISGKSKLLPDEETSWDVHFADIKPLAVGRATIITMPVLTSTSISDYDVQLCAPGDKVTFSFDIVNSGQLPAKMVTFTKPEPICKDAGTNNAMPAETDSALVLNNLIYTLKYTSGVPVAQNDVLEAGAERSVVLTIEYPSDATSLPKDKVEVQFPSVVLLYEQA